jgi:hypothetical protein
MSLRRMLVGSGAALTLTAGLLVASVPAAPAQPDYKPWGATRAPDQVLRDGCHKYRFHYRINAPTGSWAAEFLLVNRRGVGVANTAVMSESDPRKGWLRWTICRPSTVYGRHKIRMKVTYNPEPKDPTADNKHGWVEPSFFRMKRPRS